MNPPGPVAFRTVADSLANIGVTEEGGENRGKYVQTYLASVGLGPGYPWCAALVHYRLLQACHALGVDPNPHFPKSGYCPDWKQWAQSNGLWIPVDSDIRVLPGDVCLFYFASKERVAHAGIVVARKPDSSGVMTVEGNTGPEKGTEVNRDGDGIYKKDRDWGEFGSGGGFIRIPY